VGNTNIPHDIVAEESLIGSMILSTEAVVVGIDGCRVEDFYSPFNARVYGAICRLFSKGSKIDIVTISAEMNDNEAITKLSSMVIDTPSASNAQEYASIIYKHSTARSLLHKFSESNELILGGADPYMVAQGLEKSLSGIGQFDVKEPEAMTMYELEENADAIAPVVIPGMMNRDYRTIVVAEEGAGKSLLLRTIAMSASQGFHPFSHQRIDPVRCLIVDLENPTQAITQTGVPYMNMLKSKDPDNFDSERLKFWRRPGGIEIRRLSDKAELQREIASHRPELVCIGPIYKMYRRGANESYEDSADEAMAVLDDLRTKYDFALVMEHHAAKGKAGEKRDLSPMGSQRWMAWPESGISLYKDSMDPTMLHVKRYRGDRLQGIDWPSRLIRDREWLISGVWD